METAWAEEPKRTDTSVQGRLHLQDVPNEDTYIQSCELVETQSDHSECTCFVSDNYQSSLRVLVGPLSSPPT